MKPKNGEEDYFNDLHSLYMSGKLIWTNFLMLADRMEEGTQGVFMWLYYKGMRFEFKSEWYFIDGAWKRGRNTELIKICKKL